MLPIHIEIPTGGQVYRFARTIVKSDDELAMSVVYSRSWVMKSFKWLLVVIVIMLLYVHRRTVGKAFGWLGNAARSISDYYKRHEKTVENIAQSKLTAFALFGLFLWSLRISRAMTLLAFFWLCVVVIYQISSYRRRRAQARSRPAGEQ